MLYLGTEPDDHSTGSSFDSPIHIKELCMEFVYNISGDIVFCSAGCHMIVYPAIFSASNVREGWKFLAQSRSV